MILDRLTNWRRYAALHAGFTAAFEALVQLNADLPAGKREVDGDRLYVLLNRDPGRGRDGAKLESHRRYIDIQLTLAGDEEIGWLPAGDCGAASEPYVPDRDIAFYSSRPETWLALPRGTFAVFFPEDAHAPLAGQGELVKAVAKVAVEWQ
ncbi:MAG TPA: YhcH/YjgK/YiaL family protein [Pirellulales bacterium]|nr:YhcH/YjgK/YiaL family protein [Pirellulales bacterium]